MGAIPEFKSLERATINGELCLAFKRDFFEKAFHEPKDDRELKVVSWAEFHSSETVRETIQYYDEFDPQRIKSLSLLNY